MTRGQKTKLIAALERLCARVESQQQRTPREAYSVYGYVASAKDELLKALRAAEDYVV